MKLLRLPILLFAVAIFIVGCKKKDNTPANYFSFKGKTYEIIEAYLGKSIIAHHPLDSTIVYHVHQLLLTGFYGKDSAMLFLAAADGASTTLDGNYPSLPILSTDTRGIVPQADDSTNLSASSVIILSASVGYQTGQGGNIDISHSGVNYTISINSVSAGLYSNFGSQYDEIGKITGKYSGPLQLVIFSTTSGNSMRITNNFVEQAKEFTNH